MIRSEFDTTEFFMTNKEPVLFNTNNKWKDNDNNFCPICHRNYNSNYHRNYCNRQLPIGDEITPLLIISLFYYLILKNKLWKR